MAPSKNKYVRVKWYEGTKSLHDVVPTNWLIKEKGHCYFLPKNKQRWSIKRPKGAARTATKDWYIFPVGKISQYYGEFFYLK